ncbi:hypothetical protein OESDEN_03209 [Oesophagostomum dentatum]|uniref:Uncharacterized protein n=1 Tax=Oesophagostomum dentatum TaxID=61180 RepID=A0A0B1TL43_OESDE|nr:hypothetical protein OESDEN_03209 [Oesophagostomum dentatum]
MDPWNTGNEPPQKGEESQPERLERIKQKYFQQQKEKEHQRDKEKEEQDVTEAAKALIRKGGSDTSVMVDYWNNPEGIKKVASDKVEDSDDLHTARQTEPDAQFLLKVRTPRDCQNTQPTLESVRKPGERQRALPGGSHRRKHGSKSKKTKKGKRSRHDHKGKKHHRAKSRKSGSGRYSQVSSAV